MRKLFLLAVCVALTACSSSGADRTAHGPGGPKELITLEGKPQWELNREFHEAYCAHVIRWFEANGAVLSGKRA